MISIRGQNVAPSATLAITAKAKAMKAEGIDVIGFGAGEPDFDTPEHIKEAAMAAIQEGFTKYTPTAGIPELRDAVAEKFAQDNGVRYTHSQILISCGAKHSIYNLMQVLCDPGDEVIIPAPYWVSYPEMAKLAGGQPVVINTTAEDNFCVTPEALERAITPRTKAFILSSPSNPTGTLYSLDQLKPLAEILVAHQVYIIADEIYDKLVYDGIRYESITRLGEAVQEWTILVNGVSKTYAMTGWRIGYAAGPEEIIKAATNLQSHSTSGATSISQKAALAALTGPQECVEEMRQQFELRRDYIAGRFDDLAIASYVKPQGAFYIFPDVSACYHQKGRNITNSFDLATYLLEKAEVAVVPGAPFGEDRAIRLSFATSLEQIEEGLNRIQEALE